MSERALLTPLTASGPNVLDAAGNVIARCPDVESAAVIVAYFGASPQPAGGGAGEHCGSDLCRLKGPRNVYGVCGCNCRPCRDADAAPAPAAAPEVATPHCDDCNSTGVTGPELQSCSTCKGTGAAPEVGGVEVPAIVIEALEEAERWHRGSQWRDETNRDRRAAWERHRDLLGRALAALARRASPAGTEVGGVEVADSAALLKTLTRREHDHADQLSEAYAVMDGSHVGAHKWQLSADIHRALARRAQSGGEHCTDAEALAKCREGLRLANNRIRDFNRTCRLCGDTSECDGQCQALVEAQARVRELEAALAAKGEEVERLEKWVRGCTETERANLRSVLTLKEDADNARADRDRLAEDYTELQRDVSEAIEDLGRIVAHHGLASVDGVRETLRRALRPAGEGGGNG